MAFTGATAGLAAGAQTNDTRMDFALEPTYATPPSGNYQALRITGETFGRTQTTARPEEINSAKQVSQSVVTQVSASGTISGALSSGTFDDLIAGVMGNDWVNVNLVSTGDASGTSTFMYQPDDNIGGNAGCWDIVLTNNSIDALGIPPVGLLVLNDTNINANNVCIPYRVKGSAILVPIGSIPNVSKDTVAKSGASLTFSGIANSSLDKTFTIRKKLLDGFLLYSGSLVTQIQFQLQQAQFGTVSVDVTSANETQTTTDNASAVLAAPSGDVHNSVNNFLGATVFGKAPQGCLTQFTCTLARDGSANDYGMGHADACGVRTGQFTASGSLEFYFRSWDEYNACIAGTQGPIIVKTVDDSGNGYAFMFTNAALRNGKVNSSQTNQTVKASFDIEGNPSADGGPTFFIARLSGFSPTGS